MLATQQQRHLVYRYCNLNDSINSMPIALIEIILKYFQIILYCVYKGETLKDFVSSPNGTYFESKPFCIDGVTFKHQIYPNSQNGKKKGDVTFCLGIINSAHSKKVKMIHIHYELYCPQTNTLYKVNERMEPTNGEIVMFNDLKLSQCKCKNELEFRIYCHIYRIKFVNNNYKCNWTQIRYEALTIQRMISFDWDLDDHLLRLFRSTNLDGTKYYYSQNFGGFNNWYFRLCPDASKFNVAILYHMLPKDVISIYIEYEMVFICDSKALTTDTQRARLIDVTGVNVKVPVDWTEIISTKILSISIEMRIISILNEQKGWISNAKRMIKYGVV